MIEVAIMIEGQDGLNWPRWQRLATAVEELGFCGLFRSDHYTNAGAPDKDSLELWISLAWLASHTNRLEFGPLVSPVSFRHPTHTARMAAAVDDLSGGRLHLGVGAGWQVREHDHFGWQLLEIPERMRRFEEGLEVITRLLASDEPVDFTGDFYQLKEAILLPRPQRPAGPPILIGGNGYWRTLPLVARFANEWNGLFIPPARIVELNGRLDELLENEGRRPGELRRSLMTGAFFGRTDRQVAEKLGDRSADALRERGVIIGTGNEFVSQLGKIAEAGIYRVMLQWLDLDDLDGLEAIANSVLSQLNP